MLIIRIVSMFFEVIKVAILVECLLSWVPNARYGKIGTIVRTITEPIMVPCEKINDKLFKGFLLDFSPIIAYFLIYIIESIILRLLMVIL
ncbi:YggT family protein [Clostridium sp. ATCC 25772]|uniref:YggT family protein n=1 Tax=Clostridium senegalense TaxID=1465809 RepID=A0A6M0H0D3_9CLOT|nr:YggT family protein [Clostridium sp. ATCC 25772]NEU03543.1 YggT family protein [Clostridium senegalense]